MWYDWKRKAVLFGRASNHSVWKGTNARVYLSATILFKYRECIVLSKEKKLENGREAKPVEGRKGTGKAKEKTYMILPVKEYNGKEIRDVRMKAGMTQSVFASYMGVSIKTVEAWEGGRTHPTGPVFRLLDILSAGEEVEYVVAK